jgi:hypothetical protein
VQVGGTETVERGIFFSDFYSGIVLIFSLFFARASWRG